jgi:4-amino-4-deoxy-L-arabinose transferase-like glycosyltransferase
MQSEPRATIAAPRFLALLVTGALALRVGAALHWRGAPVWDGFYYHVGAASIAAGRGYAGESGQPWCHYPVGYPAFLGGVYRLFGAAPLAGTLAGAAVGAALAALVYLLARRALGETRARVAGCLAALHPGLVAYAALLMTEPLAAALLVAAAAVAARGDGGRRAAAIAGLLLGLGTLVRPQTLLCAPLVALWAPARQRLACAGIAVAVSLAVVAPWTIRNCVVMDGCAFVSTNAGWNLAIGSFPRATGRFETLAPDDGCHDVAHQVEQDRCWMRLGAAWITADPARWLSLLPRKLGFTFDHESFAIGYLATMDPEGWSARERAVGRGVLSWSHRALLVAAALALLPRPERARPQSLVPHAGLGLVAAIAAIWGPFWLVAVALVAIAVGRRRALGPAELFGAGVVASLVAVHALFFGEDRYHLVATPFLCVLAARLGAPEKKNERPADSTQPPTRARR